MKRAVYQKRAFAGEVFRDAGYQRFREQRDGIVELYRSSGKDDFNGKVKELLKSRS